MTGHPLVVQEVSESTLGINRAAIQPLILAFCVGFNLILVQWMLIHELTTLVSVSYFFGLSLGYPWVGRVKRRWLHRLAVLTLLLHLAPPIWLRVKGDVMVVYSIPIVSMIIVSIVATIIVNLIIRFLNR